MKTTAELEQQFGVPGHVGIRDKVPGYPIIEIDNCHAKASIALHGAQVLSFQPWGEDPVLWLSSDAVYSPGTAIRGGIPICWPWFGSGADDAVPAHGFARNRFWNLRSVRPAADGSTLVVLGTSDDVQSRIFWPHPFTLVLSVLVGKTLSLTLTMAHDGNHPCRITAALHSYFRVSDIAQISVSGLEDLVYIDQLKDHKKFVQSGPVIFEAELDRIYQGVHCDEIIVDRAGQRKIRLSKTGSHSTVVWNPWIDKSAAMADFERNGYRTMVCVETGNAAGDRVFLEPGESHTLGVEIAVEVASEALLQD